MLLEVGVVCDEDVKEIRFTVLENGFGLDPIGVIEVVEIHKVHLIILEEVSGLMAGLARFRLHHFRALIRLYRLELTEEVLQLLLLARELEVATDEARGLVHELLSVNLGVRQDAQDEVLSEEGLVD